MPALGWEVSVMRIEYWAHIRRTKSGSYYVTIPSGEAYKLSKAGKRGVLDVDHELVGQEVRVEVTL